jgi:predicted NBD/HSP70 family sugar kinase
LSPRTRGRHTAWANHTNTDRLEQVASLPAIAAAVEHAAAKGRPGRTAVPHPLKDDDLIDTLLEGEPWATALLRDVARVHGWVVHQLKELFDPEKIVFAGPLTGLGESFLAAVRETARQLAGGKLEVEIVNSMLGRYSGTIGAAALAMHQWKPRR